MSNATFYNFTDKPFTGYWDGKPKTVKPGEKIYWPAWLAEHFAKHLTNQVLIESGKEVYTSPKNPGQVPQFMEIFKKCYIPDKATQNLDAFDENVSRESQPSMDVVVEQPKTIEQGPAAALENMTGPGKEAQILNTPDGDDDESNFDLNNN